MYCFYTHAFGTYYWMERKKCFWNHYHRRYRCNRVTWRAIYLHNTDASDIWQTDILYRQSCYHHPYPVPVYTGWSSVHWNATGMPLVDPVYTGIPLEKLSWNSPTLECHCINFVESAPHWDATGETLTFAAYTGTPLEGLWQPTHAPTHIAKHAG